MKSDKLLQHQLKRLYKLLEPEVGNMSWSHITEKGLKIKDMIHNAILRSLSRKLLSL